MQKETRQCQNCKKDDEGIFVMNEILLDGNKFKCTENILPGLD